MINFIHEPSDYVVPQAHNEYELVYYSSGKGDTTINGETHHFKEGDIAFIAPNDVHDERTYEQAEVFCVLFTLEDKNIPSSFIESNPVISKRIYELMKTIRDEYITQDLDYIRFSEHVIEQIIILIERYHNSRKGKNTIVSVDKLVEFAKEVIQHNYNSKINFELLSENLGYSYDRFRHIFKQTTNQTLKQYQLEVRFNHAKKLLIETQLPISIIANNIGFRTVITFSQFFTNRMGISATTYREKIQSKKIEYVNLGG